MFVPTSCKVAPVAVLTSLFPLTAKPKAPLELPGLPPSAALVAPPSLCVDPLSMVVDPPPLDPLDPPPLDPPPLDPPPLDPPPLDPPPLDPPSALSSGEPPSDCGEAPSSGLAPLDAGEPPHPNAWVAMMIVAAQSDVFWLGDPDSMAALRCFKTSSTAALHPGWASSAGAAAEAQ
jgi:hypothetical protein